MNYELAGVFSRAISTQVCGEMAHQSAITLPDRSFVLKNQFVNEELLLLFTFSGVNYER